MIKTARFQNPSENIVGFWQNLVYYSMYGAWWGFQRLSQNLRCDKL